MEVLKNVKEDVVEVELASDGSWKLPTSEKENKEGLLSVILEINQSMKKPMEYASSKNTSVWAFAQFEQSLCCPPEDGLGP